MFYILLADFQSPCIENNVIVVFELGTEFKLKEIVNFQIKFFCPFVKYNIWVNYLNRAPSLDPFLA